MILLIFEMKKILNVLQRRKNDISLQWTETAKEPREEAVVKALIGARDSMLDIRRYMRLMGEAAGVPVHYFFSFIPS